jgi:hypothetical protein
VAPADVARCFQRQCPCLSPATIPPLRGHHSHSRACEKVGRSGRDDTCGRGTGEGSERTKSRSLSPFGMTGEGEAERAIPQRLKPGDFARVRALLKPCPDARNASAGPTHKAARPASEGGPYKSLAAGCGELSGNWPIGRCWEGNARRKCVGTPATRFCKIHRWKVRGYLLFRG